MYNCLGLRVRLRVNYLELANQATRLMRWFPVVPGADGAPDVTFSLMVSPPSRVPSIRRFHFLYRDGVQAEKTLEPWQLFRSLECHVDHLLSEKITSRMLLHAGVVSQNGAGVLIPGMSGAGKSSLTLSLLSCGFDYLSDEIAVINPDSGELVPFPKPVTIKNKTVFPGVAHYENLWFGPEADHPEAVWYLHPGDLGAKLPDEPVSVGYIVFPDRHSDGPARLVPLGSADAFKELIGNAINLSALGSKGFKSMANLVKHSRCYKLQSSNLEDSVMLVRELAGTAV